MLYNLSTKDANVRGTYYVDGAGAREHSLSVAAGKRLAIRANDMVDGGVFGTRFMADQNVVIERTLYLPGGSGFTTVGSGAGRSSESGGLASASTTRRRSCSRCHVEPAKHLTR